MRKTARPVVWEGHGAQSPCPDPIRAMMITVIGRGHSGTRAMSHTLSKSGVYMGAELNSSGDLIPPDMYEACRVMARHITYLGNSRWDFSKLHTVPIDPAFTRLIESFLASVLASNAERKGWKIPETTLCFPWIVRMFPDIRYIFWIRDPRDCILGKHVTDDLAAFGVPYAKTADERERRAISWKYQVELVKATPKPKYWLSVRFEDLSSAKTPRSPVWKRSSASRSPGYRSNPKPSAAGRPTPAAHF